MTSTLPTTFPTHSFLTETLGETTLTETLASIPRSIGKFEPQYDEYHRYILPNINNSGEEAVYSRVTTVVEYLKPSHTLKAYENRETIAGIVKNPTLLSALSGLDIDNRSRSEDVKTTINTIVEKAKEAAGTHTAQRFGTILHAWTEAIDSQACTLEFAMENAGIFAPYIKKYVNLLEKEMITPDPNWVERIIYLKRYGIVGTLDRIYRLADGRRVIGDLKTSSNFTMPENLRCVAAQLAGYATADKVLNFTGTQWEDMPPVNQDIALAINIPYDDLKSCSVMQFPIQDGASLLDKAYGAYSTKNWRTKNVTAYHVDPTYIAGNVKDKLEAATSSSELLAIAQAYKNVWTLELQELMFTLHTKLTTTETNPVEETTITPRPATRRKARKR